jgi:ribosomal-protein-alanine N-acetyltransferase
MSISVLSNVTSNQELVNLYWQIFQPQQNDHDVVMNGVFKDSARWYGIIDQSTKKILAFCTVGILSNDKMFMYNIAVHPNYRRQGLAQQMLREVFEMYPTHNIYLFVNKKNRTAIKLYQKLNFTYAEKVFIPPEGEVCLVRSL